jgi:hypothetical protein
MRSHSVMMIGYSNRDSRLFYKMHIWDCQKIFYASFVCSLHESLPFSEQFHFLNGQFGHDVVLCVFKTNGGLGEFGLQC